MTNSIILNLNDDDDVHIFYFGPKVPYLGKFGPQNQNRLIQMKLAAYTNSSTVNSMVMFICPVLDRKYTLRANMLQKINIF